ncbi:MAG: Ubiquinone biosynthesis O-methyltransferase [candidate division WS2 bacterium]|nr:Ubiquinone biosynthesis O-methyltransferase [Candidatus Lithacetigena glycinireducens]
MEKEDRQTELKTLIRELYTREGFNTLSPETFRDYDSWIDQKIDSEKRQDRYLAVIKRYFGNLRTKRILEVGCGTGGTIVAMRKEGSIVCGVDSFIDTLKIARLRGKINNQNNFLINASGEDLPFRCAVFDGVLSLQVLEHVQDIEKVVSEMYRVVRKGGFIYVETPNFNSFYESHFKRKWLPRMPRTLAYWYFKLSGFKNAHFIYALNYTTPLKIRKTLSRFGLKITNPSLESKLEKIYGSQRSKGWRSLIYKMLSLLPLRISEKIVFFVEYYTPFGSSCFFAIKK